jgi:methyl-accepting chemotaxis protein
MTEDKAPASAVPHYRRRHYFIDRRFQGAFLVHFVGATLIAAGVAGFVVYRSLESALEEQMFSAHLRVASTCELMRGRLIMTNLVVAILLFAVAVGLVYRVAKGCSFAFKRARIGIERVGEGDLTVQVWAKASDHLEGLFQELNATIEHARDKATLARTVLAESMSSPSSTIEQKHALATNLRRCAAVLREIGPRP